MYVCMNEGLEVCMYGGLEVCVYEDLEVHTCVYGVWINVHSYKILCSVFTPQV